MNDVVVRRRFAAPVDADAVRRDWLGRGYSCEWWIDPPGQAWRDFVHDTNELVTVVEGRLRLVVGRDEVMADAGDEVFIPRRTPHSVFNVHRGTTRWLFGYD